MKTLQEYIYESKRNFVLTNSERDSLIEILGYLTGNLGEKSDNEQFSELIKTLSNEQLKQLESLYDLIENTETYPKINRSLLKDDIELLQIILKWIDKNGLFEDMYELQDIMEKIL